jgi:hypothetical protein
MLLTTKSGGMWKRVLSQISILGVKSENGSRKFNGLQTPKLSKKQLCDRTALGLNPKDRFIDKTVMTGRATPRLAKPFTFMEHEAARPTARRFHHQTLLAMMQTFPYMRKMRKDFLLRDAHAGREFFGSRRPFQEDVDYHLTNRLRHGRSPLVDPIKHAALL